MTSSNNVYDIVIVGAGPSAMGLIYGLLLPYSREANAENYSDSNRITPNFTIAVVERGEGSSAALHPSINTRDPKRWGYAAFESSSSSVLYTVPQHGLHKRIIGVPVGNGVGGGSNVNAGLVCQPHADDFQSWYDGATAALDGDGEQRRVRLWAADTIVTAAKIIESDMDTNRALTRRGNWLANRLWDRRVDGATVTFNSNMSLMVRTSLKNTPIRTNYYEALVQPLLEANPHLNKYISFINNMLVERVLFTTSSQLNTTDSSSFPFYTATGIECSNRRGSSKEEMKHYQRIDARKFVIVCAGAILSPALLLASGIGEPAALEQAGITPLWTQGMESWKGVGQGLNDHIILPRFFLTTPNSWTNNNGDRNVSIISDDTKERTANFQSSINGVQGWVTIDIPRNVSTQSQKNRCLIKVFDGTATPWLLPEMVFSTLHRPYLLWMIVANVAKKIIQLLCCLCPVRYLIQRYTKLWAICLMSPKSKGSVTLVRRRERNGQKPSLKGVNRLSDYDISVDPAYLQEEEEDVESLQWAWNYSIPWSLQGNSIEILPSLYKFLISSTSKTDEPWFRSFASDFTNPFFHWSGSLRMKPMSYNLQAHTNGSGDKDYVCEEDLRVRNTSNLYVSCASVFPNPISVPTALTCAALGFAFAEMILSKQLSTISQVSKDKLD